MAGFSIRFALITACLAVVAPCSSVTGGGQSTEETRSPAIELPLPAPASSAGRAHNDEGVGKFTASYWDMAADHFREAIQADPNLAEAHFNLGLALDRMGKRLDAKASFKRALELAPTNPAIKDSAILKKHLRR